MPDNLMVCIRLRPVRNADSDIPEVCRLLTVRSATARPLLQQMPRPALAAGLKGFGLEHRMPP